jgi:hypothetical protein
MEDSMQKSISVRAFMVAATLAMPLCSIPYAAAAKATGHATAVRGTAIQVPLSKVSNPIGRLANASVQDKNGESVGTVHKVMVDKQGAPTNLEVDVGGFLGVGTKMVEIPASKLRYEQDRNVLTTTLRKPQIKSLPEIKS